jgi:hypothetical protein
LLVAQTLENRLPLTYFASKIALLLPVKRQEERNISTFSVF